uniref:Uncharacterized protein n=1 Tax=Moniliophthora roreri TaxID=221103 RepID=A0A0W0F6J3_MONRR
MSSSFHFHRRHRVGLPNINNITNIHQQACLDIKLLSSRALGSTIPISHSGVIAGIPAEVSPHTLSQFFSYFMLGQYLNLNQWMELVIFGSNNEWKKLY